MQKIVVLLGMLPAILNASSDHISQDKFLIKYGIDTIDQFDMVPYKFEDQVAQDIVALEEAGQTVGIQAAYAQKILAAEPSAKKTMLHFLSGPLVFGLTNWLFGMTTICACGGIDPTGIVHEARNIVMSLFVLQGICGMIGGYAASGYLSYQSLKKCHNYVDIRDNKLPKMKRVQEQLKRTLC